MKIKGAVRFFAIALAVVCLFQLSFTFVGNYWDKKADRYAHGDAVRKRHFLDSISRKPIYNILVYKYNYLDVKKQELNLGLDLRGGMHVTLEVAADKLLKQLSANSPDPVFNQALVEAKKQKITSQRNYVDIFYDVIRQMKPNVQLSAYFATLENKQSITLKSTNEEVVTYLKGEVNSALDRTYKILRTRIDKFGVTQPNTQIDPTTGRIVVELPGANDPDRVRNLLKQTAKLEFYETYTINEVESFLADADKAVYAYQQSHKNKDSLSKKGLDTADNQVSASKPGSATASVAGKKDSTDKKDAKAKENKVTPLLTALNQSQQLANGAVVGIVRIGDTASVNKMLNLQVVKDALPPEAKLAWANKPNPGSDLLELYALRTTGLTDKEAVLYGDVITDARQDVDRNTNAFEVTMQMSPEGASEWANITRRNVGKFVAIVLDNQVYSCPRVNQEIDGGNSQITGNFNAAEASDLANVLKSGKLPVELDVVDEAVVGPSMGQQAINSGLASLLIGLLAITAFMVLYYNRSGWVANLALLINLFFIIGVLASLGASLTMPGMAGIVLTLAMAVDANVLIYERIREELGHEKSIKMAISDGYRHAMSSIIDGNITTLLIGIILMAFGQGPVYGFAVVLVIGILTSLFTSILVSRLIFDWLLEKDSKINFGNKFTSHLLSNINFDFVGKRKIGYWFSGITLTIGIVSLAFNGLNYGVEFKGGYSYVVSFDKAVNIEDVRSTLKPVFGHEPEVKTFGSNDKVNIVTDYLVGQNNDQTDAKVKAALEQGLSHMQGYHYKIESTQKVGSTIASDIKNSAFYSIVLGLLVVFLYIVIRFKRWQFAFGATLALAHDTVFVLGLFSIFKDILPFTDVDQAVVAALLTVAGYSVNDTVVVFDRIREYLRGNKKSPMIPTVNQAINKTLNRTVITSFTVFLVVLILFIFGGHIIRGFSFAMLVGIVVGTYSSIFVATPIAVDLQKKEELEATSF